MAKSVRPKQIHLTKQTLSDLRVQLQKFLNNEEMVDKILEYLERWGNLSNTFLCHKFKITTPFANEIMAILNKSYSSISIGSTPV